MCGVAGLIHPTYKGRVRATVVELTTATGKAQYSLPDKGQFKAPYQILGFSHRAFSSGRKSKNGGTLVNATLLKVSHLSVKKGHSDEFLDIPIENVLNDLTGYRDVYWIQPTQVDAANSSIIVGDTAAISAGEVFELIVYTTDDPSC